MERKTKRTIKEVLDIETGECIDADDFFKKPLDELTVYRSELQKVIEGFREPLFTCYYCKQKIRIRGGIAAPHKRKAEIFHFAHLKDSDECHIKTKNHYTKDEVNRIKYNGAKESTLHQTLKDNIAESLRRNQETKKEVVNVEVEKVIRDKVAKEWKKPDINAFFLDKRIAIELQLSTTWLDVITRRQEFYKEQGIYIFWVFHTFNSNDDVRKLTYNDVIYTNNQNAYIFDKDTYEKSKEENDLILKCYYKSYFRDDLKLGEHWKYSLIKLSDLTFDEKKFRIFYHDTEKQKKIIEQEIEEHLQQLRESGRLKILEEQEQERKRLELESKIEDLTDEIDGIKIIKKEIQDKEEKAKTKLTEKKDFLAKVNEHTDKTVKYFSDSKNSYKPFYDNDTLLKTLREEFAERLKIAVETIQTKNKEQEIFTKNLTGISKLTTVEIAAKTYSSINISTDWDFIKKNFSEIKVINKNLVNGLFATDEMRPIKSDYDLNQLQFSKNNYFLMDFTSKVTEFNKQKKINQELIDEQETLITKEREEIKQKMEKNFQEEIVKLDDKLKSLETQQEKLNIVLNQKENERTKLDRQKHSR